MATIGELFVNLNANTSNFDRGMDRASNKANGLGRVIETVSKNIASFMIYDVGKKLVSGFIEATKAGIDYNATLETSSIKWETLLGSQEKANKMLKDIEKFAATTPFEKMGVDTMATYLNNADIKGQALFDQLTKFGDLAGAFGIQADSLQEMVRQYSQVKQAGVAYTEDLNILQERGIPIFKALGEELGINTADVKKWASEGKISADIYQKALDGLSKDCEGGMSKMSESFTGVISTIKDTFSKMTGVLAQPIFEKLKEGSVQLRDKLSLIVDSLSENGLMGTIQEFAPGIEPFVQTAINIFQTMADTMGVIIQSMTDFWNEHKSWLMPLITFVWTFISTFIMNTITAIGNVVQSGLAIIDGIINFFQNLFQGNFSGCWESIKQIFSNAITFVWNWMQVQFAVNIPNMIKNFAKNIPALLSNMWGSIKGFFSGGISACLGFIKNLISNGVSNFNTLRTFGANVFQGLWQVAKNAMSNLLKSVISNIKQVPVNVKNFMDDAIQYLKDINLYQIGKDIIQGLINGIKGMGKSVADAVGGACDSAIDWARKKLGINSPSKVFKQFGIWTGQGYVNGVDEENSNVGKASARLANNVVSGFNNNYKASKISTNISLDKQKFDYDRMQEVFTDSLKNLDLGIIMDAKRVGQLTSRYSDDEIKTINKRKNRLAGV
ncbi:tail length tape measure protein [Terrisporobacter phage TVCOM_ph1]